VDNKLQMYLEASIDIEEPTEERKEMASACINLPTGKDKQADLLYFSAVFVSSGANLNHAYFLPSELIAAEETIQMKGVDMEHIEDNIVGHIYDKTFVDEDHNPLQIEELAKLETAALDEKDIHIVIAGVVYKHRFPEIADEIDKKLWKVSMECFYQSYDVKIGNTIISKPEAELLGLACEDNTFGKIAKIIKDGKEVANGVIDRVLRGVHFAGVGFVKNPANPPSVVLETATNDVTIADENNCIVIINEDLESAQEDDNNVTSNRIETSDNDDPVSKDEIIVDDQKNIEDKLETEDSDLVYKDTVGICVNYKKQITDKNGSIIHKNWCTAYRQECTSFSRDTTDPDCLRNQIKETVKAVVSNLIACDYSERSKEVLLNELKAALHEAVKTLS